MDGQQYQSVHPWSMLLSTAILLGTDGPSPRL